MQTHHPPPPSAHRCKVCKKSFPCGRSLGGHMRSHVNMVALTADDDRPPSSYALRENPKKTWRLSDSLYGDAEEKCCAECGKEFLTWRALFGHIKSHRPASEEKQEPENRGVCEITPVPQRRPRSRRTPAMASCSFSSSEHEREDEDGAISLMMLSRDCGFWLGSESSAKNSVFSEGKDYGKGTELDQCVGEEFKKTWICSSSTDEFGDSGEELAKASSGTGIEATPLKKGDEDVKHSSTNLQSFEADRVKLVSNKNAGEKRSRFECLACKKTFRSYQALGGHRASHKRLKGCGTSCSSRDTGELVDPSEVSEASFGTGKKSKEHECSICGKVFSSGQALGGHKRCHPVATSDSHDTASLLDLNFPANADGDSNSTNAVNSTELKTWWIEGSLDHEAVVSVISSN